jgi:hypothetical protein
VIAPVHQKPPGIPNVHDQLIVAGSFRAHVNHLVKVHLSRNEPARKCT